MVEAWPDLWWAHVFVGLVCGTFGATFGVGSGIIMIPALVLMFGFPQKSAQAMCLAVMVPMALVGTIRYKLNPAIEVNMMVVAVLASGAVVGAVIGSGIASWVSGLILRRLFAMIMIVVAVRMLMPGPAEKAQDSEDRRAMAVQPTDPSSNEKNN